MMRAGILAALVALAACSQSDPPPMPVEAPAPSPAPVRTRPFANGKVHLPAFTFRPLEGGGRVLINGEELSATLPCLWSITDAIEFDPKIPVSSWPPDDAVAIGSTSHPDSGSADLYIARAPALSHLKPNEAVIYVKGRVGDRAIQGGLRLLVEGCRYVDYTPVNPEGDAAGRFLRTIWFEPVRNK